jgi:hypothetical protein
MSIQGDVDGVWGRLLRHYGESVAVSRSPGGAWYHVTLGTGRCRSGMGCGPTVETALLDALELAGLATEEERRERLGLMAEFYGGGGVGK